MARGGRIFNRIVMDGGIPTCPACGVILDDARSIKHLGLLFVFIKHLFETWPDAGVDGFRPVDEKHLRKWLIVKARHIQPYCPVPFGTKKEKELAIRVLTAQMESDRINGLYGWPQEVEGGCIAVLRPASIRIYGDDAISEQKFCEVTRNIFDFVYEALGIDVKEWKESGKKGSGS